MTDWEDRRLRIKARIAAIEDRLEQLHNRREGFASQTGGIVASPQDLSRTLKAAQQWAAAAMAAAADELEQSSDAHHRAAGAHEAAASNAPHDVAVLAHMHSAEAHRAAARQDLQLARTYREAVATVER